MRISRRKLKRKQAPCYGRCCWWNDNGGGSHVGGHGSVVLVLPLVAGVVAFFVVTTLGLYALLLGKTLADYHGNGNNIVKGGNDEGDGRLYYSKPFRRGGRRQQQQQQQRPIRTTPTLRQLYEHDHPNIQVQQLQHSLPRQPIESISIVAGNNDNNNNNNNNNMPFDYSIHQCPPDVPPNYPYAWNILDVLHHWHPDDTNIPRSTHIHQSLCWIDWNNDIEEQQQQQQPTTIATRYQQAEVPFLVKNHPTLLQTAERWSHYEYMEQLLSFGDGGGGDGHHEDTTTTKRKTTTKRTTTYRNEHSTHTHHMMYWKMRNVRGAVPKGWTPPTDDVDLTFAEWYEKAMALESTNATTTSTSTNTTTTTADHYYLRLNGVHNGQGDFLYDELPIFQATTATTTTEGTTSDSSSSSSSSSTIFMVDPAEARGINCRLGSKGTTAELHFDQSRNFIAILKGSKRYLLAHPSQCPHLKLHPMGHPSARHSSVNWSNADEWQQMQEAKVMEVVLQAGDGLYLPTYWFHFIVSLELNYQCNARSGMTYENQHEITKCGF